MSKTIDDLQTAFSGESQAHRKYMAYARKAEEENFPHVAKLFRAAAHAEVIHALNHFRAMDGIKSTAENLQAAIAGENYEATTMYPPMLAQAGIEGNKRAARSFGWALGVEKIHEELYRKAAEIQANGKDIPAVDYYICPVCGYTHEGIPPEKCPICGAAGEKFAKIG